MQQERILVVDDEAPVRGIVAALLEHSGYTAITASGANEAIELLAQDPTYSLVLSDIMMPGTDGLALLDRISADHPGLPVIMFTAVHDIHVATSAFRRGAFDYLLKPFERIQLESVVSRAVDHSRHLRQNNAYRHHLEEMIAARTGRLRATMQDLERSYDITIEAMGDALDLRDQETEGHCRRVTDMTVKLAEAMGLSEAEIVDIRRGALLHDIGKMGVPDAILLKPGPLTDDEWRVMRMHPVYAKELLSQVDFLQNALTIPYCHHEKWDGTGYPQGLSGEDIPLDARLFCIVDVWDALRSDRPYRKGWPDEKIFEHIKSLAGSHFEPAIVDLFVSIAATEERPMSKAA